MKRRDITLEEIVTTLKTGLHTIDFEKIDGSLRTFNATLDPEAIGAVPSDKTAEEYTRKEGTQTALAIFEMDPGQWRSFRLNNLIKFNGENVKYVETK